MRTSCWLLAGWLLAPSALAQEPCARLSVAGLRPGMTVAEVRAAMESEPTSSQVVLPDGTRATAEDYSSSQGVVHVEYDGSARRRETRVAFVRQPLGQTDAAVTVLLARLGQPVSGPDALAGPLQAGRPAIWIDEKCDLVLVYYRRTGYWVADDVSTFLRVERLSLLAEGSPAAPDVQAWRASAAPPPAPPVAVEVARVEAPALQAAAPAGDTPPQRTKYVAPVYPELAKEQGVKGYVKLRVLVQRSGRIAIVRVADVEPTGYGFEKACVDAAEQWKFTPAMSNGRPVEGVAEFTIPFP